MSTIKISELATSDISLSDFFAKADANGLATKNTIQGLSTFFETVGEVGFKGSLAIADTPTLDGWYFASESGTYTNAGSLVVNITNQLVIIIIADTQTTFSKVDIPLGYTVATSGTVLKNSTDLFRGGDIAFEMTEQMIICSPNAININGSGSSWTLEVANATVNFRYKTLSKNNIAVSKSLTDGYNFLIFNYTTGDIEIYTSQSTAVDLLKDKNQYFFIGACFPKINLFDFRCDYSKNGVASVFNESANGYAIHSLTAQSNNVSITDSSGVWKLEIPAASLGMLINETKINNTATSITLATGISYNWIIGDITTGNITATSSDTTANGLLEDNERYILIGRINVTYNLYDMRCPFNVNGVDSILFNPLDTFTADIDIDIPILTDTIAFTDDNELPIYKNSLFKFLASAKKYDVVIESVNSEGKYKRYDIHNPTYLKKDDLVTGTRVIFQSKEKNNKFIFKSISNLIKSTTTGKSGSYSLLTIGDSITQGNAGITSMPLAIIKDRMNAIGVTVNGVGTFAMDLGETSGTAPTSSYMGEGRGFWNYKNFVGKENSPYGQAISVATGTGATLKFENPFLRLADATDKSNNPEWCFTNSTENPADPDGVSYADNATYTNYYIFDFDNYKTVRGVTPDIITLALGTNDWQETGTINVDDEFLSFQIMYAQIRASLPTTPILIVPTQPLFMIDQPEWENEMFELAEKIIKEIESYQVTDSNLHTIPIFQHMSRFNAFKTFSNIEFINENSTIKKCDANDVHILDKSTSRDAYMDVFESVFLSVI